MLFPKDCYTSACRWTPKKKKAGGTRGVGWGEAKPEGKEQILDC